MSLSINATKHIRSLHQKKYREKLGQFIVEGDKMVCELLQFDPDSIQSIYAVYPWIDQNHHLQSESNYDLIAISEKELKKISTLNTPNQVLAVCKKANTDWRQLDLKGQLVLYLENLQDPGNLGTIIRTADWFGVDYVFCSKKTVEFYNPKVIQATMGAFMRVDWFSAELKELHRYYPELPIFGMTLYGNNIYEYSLSSSGIIVVGNESKGISDATMEIIQHDLKIPSFRNRKMESLNAAVATAITLAIFRQK